MLNNTNISVHTKNPQEITELKQNVSNIQEFIEHINWDKIDAICKAENKRQARDKIASLEDFIERLEAVDPPEAENLLEKMFRYIMGTFSQEPHPYTEIKDRYDTLLTYIPETVPGRQIIQQERERIQALINNTLSHAIQIHAIQTPDKPLNLKK